MFVHEQIQGGQFAAQAADFGEGGGVCVVMGHFGNQLAARAFYREFFLADEIFEAQDQVKVAVGVGAAAADVLARGKAGDDAFPVAQDMRPDAGDFLHVAD